MGQICGFLWKRKIAKAFSFRGASPPDPHRGLCPPGTLLGALPPDPVIGSRSPLHPNLARASRLLRPALTTSTHLSALSTCKTVHELLLTLTVQTLQVQVFSNQHLMPLACESRTQLLRCKITSKISHKQYRLGKQCMQALALFAQTSSFCNNELKNAETV